MLFMTPQLHTAGPTSPLSTTNSAPKVWFITGASRGFGRVWAEAALQRGDKVAATARQLASLADLTTTYGANVLTLALDGTIEEASLDEIRAMYETNVYGAVSVIQAALPLLRAQGSGHILGTSSAVGQITLPVIGYYCSSKWAFEAIHESLAVEVAPFGIKVTLIEPGAYATEFGSPESLRFAAGLEAYTDFKNQFLGGLGSMPQGDPAATPAAIFAVVDAEQPPLRLFLGSHNLPAVRTAYTERLATWEAWETVANAAQGAIN
jgi:NADP-dependent 3-hydroxy acid dehydrogenase YdfG